MRPGGQYEGLLQCQQEGLIDHIVCSSHQPGAEIRQIMSEGKVEGVLLGMNILNYPYRWDGVQAANELGYGVVAMNPLAGGLIPQNAAKLGFLTHSGETPVEAALRFIISCPQISVALNGFTTRDQVDMACRIADECQPFSQDELASLQQHLTANMNAICTTCGYCDHCPQQIPIPSFMQYYNQRQMFNSSDEEMIGQLRHDESWGLLVGRKADASACVKCGQCEEVCTQHLNIIERLQQIAEWERALKSE
jgi:predicted aldo/keto reductase-like oxidoreductase